MLKTVKGKVIAGTLAFGLISGAGVVFGASDAGTQLKNWYDTQFNKSSNEVAGEVTNYALGKVDGLVNEYNGLKTDATNRINSNAETATNVTNNGINNRAGEHIDSIKEQKIEIENHLEIQFQAITSFAAGLINETGQKTLDYANTDLKAHATAVGSDAYEKMTREIEATTDRAVKDLEDTIAYAKTDLQQQLNKNTNLTIEEIKGLIDAKIDELRTKITSTNNSLIKEQERLLTIHAKALLLKGQGELDSIVNGINK